ncbi:hypothetical protein NIES2100_18460 [Calothrix sp. NIES-2100]|uniref:DUF6658 family protein n=1 Tax=Calothrix sp. NIES-2100 TaxID=1954172 RepID=UPI000B5E1013|nr:hypothetical protein NIES2100_18460 [Calothrix sp. NIES-2100]
MNRLTALLKKLRLHQILTVFLASLFLIVSTVTNSSNQNQRDQASSLELNSQLLIATATTNRESEILYPGAETPAGRLQKEAELPLITEKNFQQPEPGGLIQRQSDVGNRIQDRLETVKETFKDASGFLQNKADEASARPELQKNPAVGR